MSGDRYHFIEEQLFRELGTLLYSRFSFPDPEPFGPPGSGAVMYLDLDPSINKHKSKEKP
jgi:hypothetical protein